MFPLKTYVLSIYELFNEYTLRAMLKNICCVFRLGTFRDIVFRMTETPYTETFHTNSSRRIYVEGSRGLNDFLRAICGISWKDFVNNTILTICKQNS